MANPIRVYQSECMADVLVASDGVVESELNIGTCIS